MILWDSRGVIGRMLGFHSPVDVPKTTTGSSETESDQILAHGGFAHWLQLFAREKDSNICIHLVLCKRKHKAGDRELVTAVWWGTNMKEDL